MRLTISGTLFRWTLAFIASITLLGTTALGAASPGPTAKPFFVVTLGDSVMWGQGLPDGQKFRDLVTAWVQTQFGASRQVVQIPSRSHSGAQITVDASEGDTAPNLSGEIPSGHPSISLQVDLTVSDLKQRGIDPSAIDLVLVDGGANDVSVLEILKPNHSTATIQRFTNASMDKMSDLLPKVMRSFPSAAIVVTGYYQIVSSDSPLTELVALFGAFGSELGGPVGALGTAGLVALDKPQMVATSQTFANTTHQRLVQIIAQQNSSRVALAWPDFQSLNAYGAQSTFLWKATDFVGPEIDGAANRNPQPPATPNGVAWNRARACAVANRASPKCLDASMGHPNQLGAQAYSAAILGQIETTLAPHLATRGLVENPACAPLRAQEATALGTVRGVQEMLAGMGKEQRDCQAGIGQDGGRGYKPKQCGALEIEAEKKKLNAQMEQANVRFESIERQKRQAGCWR